VGLVADIRPSDAELTLVGTPGYMPPPPEHPGTVQADIYGLGMVLYVILTGREPNSFPEVGTALVENTPRQDFIRLNSIITKACQPDRAKRYVTVAEMHRDLDVIRQGSQRADFTANI
jgi:serine/threonine protein kinase